MKVMPVGLLIGIAGFGVSFWRYGAGYAVIVGGWLLCAIGWLLHTIERRGDHTSRSPNKPG